MRLHHPTIPGKTVDVPIDCVDDWLAQGWVRRAPARRPRKRRTK